MIDYYEIDFLKTESKQSGDAIPLRYRINGVVQIHVIDGGFEETGITVCDHVNRMYGSNEIHRVIVTHPDMDHTSGLKTVLEQCEVRELWMLRPWLYAEELIQSYPTYNSIDKLVSKLRKDYPRLAVLEEIALSKGIPIYEPFQGAAIGAFTVCAPTKNRYLNLIVTDDNRAISEEQNKNASSMLQSLIQIPTNVVKSLWGEEYFPVGETGPRNEMSVVQYAEIANQKILLTGDSGRVGLNEAADFLEYCQVPLPGINLFDVPHHGSRRNLSTEILDRLIGQRLEQNRSIGCEAVVSASKEDQKHPRKVVIRACMHRGLDVVTTQHSSICCSHNITRENWHAVPLEKYPDEQEM